MSKVRGQRQEVAFVEGTVKYCKTAKTLLKKIDKHQRSTMHANALHILEEQQKDKIKLAAEATFVERNAENVRATAVVFRTAYEGAHSHLSFREHERLLDCCQPTDLNAETCFTHIMRMVI